jgi:hypothetical protein
VDKEIWVLANVRLPANVFATAGLDYVTSAICIYQHQFRFDIQCSALVHKFNNIFLNEYLFRAGQPMYSAFANTQVLGDKPTKPLLPGNIQVDNYYDRNLTLAGRI